MRYLEAIVVDVQVGLSPHFLVVEDGRHHRLDGRQDSLHQILLVHLHARENAHGGVGQGRVSYIGVKAYGNERRARVSAITKFPQTQKEGLQQS